MVQYVNLEIVERETIPYDGKQAFQKRNNTTTISIADLSILARENVPQVSCEIHISQSMVKGTITSKDKSNP